MITLMIGNIAGLIAFSIAKDYGVDAIVAYDNKELYKEMGFNVFNSIKDNLPDSKMLLSVHGREIVPVEILKRYEFTANVHPFFNKYKGGSPIKRALEDWDRLADVTSHIMIEKVDSGEILFQETMTIKGETQQEIYAELYPLYAKVIKKTIEEKL